MKTLRYISVAVLSIVILVMLVSSCSTTIGYVGTNIGNRIEASFHQLNGSKTKNIGAETGETIELSYSSVVEEGKLSIKVQDSQKDLVVELETGTTGTESIVIGNETPYRVVITGDDAKGSFDVSWEIR